MILNSLLFHLKIEGHNILNLLILVNKFADFSIFYLQDHMGDNITSSGRFLQNQVLGEFPQLFLNVRITCNILQGILLTIPKILSTL